MIFFVIALNVLCPNVRVLNSTNVWNDIDKAQINFSKKRCYELYKDAPCLKYFWKVEPQVYRAICGRPNE